MKIASTFVSMLSMLGMCFSLTAGNFHSPIDNNILAITVYVNHFEKGLDLNPGDPLTHPVADLGSGIFTISEKGHALASGDHYITEINKYWLTGLKMVTNPTENKALSNIPGTGTFPLTIEGTVEDQDGEPLIGVNI